ncbi:shikimate kinase [Streptomyces lavenduligriseus]|uniref:Shikimate kinase n=1 Tax=Streptomyces lavenduligriseus TaxID=67315 RepID=A0ABT0NU88_9ACTN|nr:shikimate kinase [Streptomyces lavenduligriseus]MCL3994318.1 shikimate kinase [Streptomyces lavenduligriseus]
MTGPAAILIGMPGVGKTSVGRELAGLLGVSFRDTDEDVTRLAGRPAPEVLREKGEPAFRLLEHQAVAAALAEHEGVLALGGGAVLHDGTRARLHGCRVVHLWAGLDTLACRVLADGDRPLLDGDPRAGLALLMRARLPLYRRLAVVSVRAEDRGPREIAEEIAALLASAAP